jgi:hypothetical protein
LERIHIVYVGHYLAGRPRKIRLFLDSPLWRACGIILYFSQPARKVVLSIYNAILFKIHGFDFV